MRMGAAALPSQPPAKGRTGQHARQRIQRVRTIKPQVCERDDARAWMIGLPLGRCVRIRAPQRCAAEEVQALQRGHAALRRCIIMKRCFCAVAITLALQTNGQTLSVPLFKRADSV